MLCIRWWPHEQPDMQKMRCAAHRSPGVSEVRAQGLLVGLRARGADVRWACLSVAGLLRGEEEMRAVFSADKLYRYRLGRDLGLMGDGACCFVMLNPSTATEVIDDPTIRRCIGYAKTLGCNQLEVVNIFAYRSTDPQALYGLSKEAAIGPENDYHIAKACNGARIIICGWGNHGALHGRGAAVLGIIRSTGAKPMALKINGKSRQPSHPLYLKADAVPAVIA